MKENIACYNRIKDLEVFHITRLLWKYLHLKCCSTQSSTFDSFADAGYNRDDGDVVA